LDSIVFLLQQARFSQTKCNDIIQNWQNKSRRSWRKKQIV
jgi:hypothetical protein